MAASIIASNAATTTVTNETSIVQTSSFSFVPTGEFTQTFSKFDTLAGTRLLSSVSVKVSYTKTGGQFSIDNESEAAANVNLTHRITTTVSSDILDLTKNTGSAFGFNGGTNLLRASSVLTNIAIAPDDGDSSSVFDATGADYYRFEPGDLTVSDTGLIANTVQFGGAGSYTFTFDTAQTVLISGDTGMAQAFFPSTMNGYTEVTYNFTNVPEPSAALLGGLGLLALARRRR